MDATLPVMKGKPEWMNSTNPPLGALLDSL